MNFKHILCPYDYSLSSDEAAKMAASIARESGSKLTLLHVEETPLAYGAGFGGYIPPRPESAAVVDKLRQAMPMFEGVDCYHNVVSGTPSEEIVRFAEEHHVDLIVIGTHGHTGLAHLLMGSVAAAVVRRAHCPVLACKQPHGAVVSPKHA